MMTDRQVQIIIAEDDPGHFRLIQKNLDRAGLSNPIVHFDNGQSLLDYLFCRPGVPQRSPDTALLLLLDIRMPKVDGIEVLRQLKADPHLRRIPVIMLTTTDDPQEVRRCHSIGCSHYIVKPVDYEKFSRAIKHVGLFISLIRVPDLEDPPSPHG